MLGKIARLGELDVATLNTSSTPDDGGSDNHSRRDLVVVCELIDGVDDFLRYSSCELLRTACMGLGLTHRVSNVSIGLSSPRAFQAS